MAEDPMPASQAKTILWIAPVLPAARVELAIDCLPFIDSICDVAAARSPSSLRSVLRSRAATTKETAAAPKTPIVTPRKSPAGVCA